MPGTSAPDVTVVVPVYNTMPYLTACVRSLVEQSIGAGRLQVVAVDDCSTDGSGEELDRWAARHPDVLEVVHLPANSGGPATPCNVGLEQARGRYVFFVGADDYLGPEALERMVDAADGWGSDVLCVKPVAVGGRFVLQDLYRASTESVPFPSQVLCHAISNTKLFRRSVLTEHGIDYPLDLRIGSDQPFTIAAMRHAAKISVLADYDFYYGVKREDHSNLSFSSTWRTRLDCISAVMHWVAEQYDVGPERSTILQRHFAVELSKLLRWDLHDLDAAEQAELVDGVRELIDAYYDEQIDRELRVPQRLRMAHAAAGDLDALRALAGLEEQRWPLVVADPPRQRMPGYGTCPDSWYDVTAEPLQRTLGRAVREGRLRASASGVVAEVDTDLDAASTARISLIMVRAAAGTSNAARAAGAAHAPWWQSAPVVPAADGTLAAPLDLARLVGADRVPFALRVQVEHAGTTYTIPAKSTETTTVAVETDATPMTTPIILGLRPDPHGRSLLEVDPTAAPTHA